MTNDKKKQTYFALFFILTFLGFYYFDSNEKNVSPFAITTIVDIFISNQTGAMRLLSRVFLDR